MLRVADHVAHLASQHFLAGLGPGRHAQLHAPRDFVFVILHKLDVREIGVLMLLGRFGRYPVAIDREASRVEKVECGVDGAAALLRFGVLVDVVAGIQLRRDLECHGVARLSLVRSDQGGQLGGFWLDRRPRVLFCRLGSVCSARAVARSSGRATRPIKTISPAFRTVRTSTSRMTGCPVRFPSGRSRFANQKLTITALIVGVIHQPDKTSERCDTLQLYDVAATSD